MPATRLIALVVDATRSYHRKMVPGVADYVREAGNWRLYVEEGPQERLPDFRDWKGDGILSTLENPRVVESLVQLRIPVVGMERVFGDKRTSHIPCIGTNNEVIGRLGARHLLDQGFQRLAFCGFPRARLTEFSQKRAESFRRCAEEAGCPCSVYAGRHVFARKWLEMQRAMSDWLASLETPVGVMACNDARARHVLEACRAIGARVPDDVAVIGVDNDEILCEVTQPKLTSIEQGARRIGYLAAKTLDRMLSGKKPLRRDVYVEPEGVVRRQSTDVLAVDDPDIAEAIRYVREHACKGMRLEDLVEHVHLSRSSLASKFKATLGRSVHEEIRRVQLELAKELLIHSSLSPKQIAARAGFSHVQHLSRVLREALGCPPGEFRSRWKR